MLVRLCVVAAARRGGRRPPRRGAPAGALFI